MAELMNGLTPPRQSGFASTGRRVVGTGMPAAPISGGRAAARAAFAQSYFSDRFEGSLGAVSAERSVGAVPSVSKVLDPANLEDLQEATQKEQEDTLLASNLSLAKHHMSMGIIRNIAG